MMVSACAWAAETPSSVIHVVTVKWKDGTTDDQIAKAVDGVKDMAKSYPGITRVWLKTLKVQGKGYKSVIAMEFASQDALKKYAGSDAQKKWYDLYMPIREESTTHDVTN
jgi:hypothetical protein